MQCSIRSTCSAAHSTICWSKFDFFLQLFSILCLVACCYAGPLTASWVWSGVWNVEGGHILHCTRVCQWYVIPFCVRRLWDRWARYLGRFHRRRRLTRPGYLKGNRHGKPGGHKLGGRRFETGRERGTGGTLTGRRRLERPFATRNAPSWGYPLLLPEIKKNKPFSCLFPESEFRWVKSRYRTLL